MTVPSLSLYRARAHTILYPIGYYTGLVMLRKGNKWRVGVCVMIQVAGTGAGSGSVSVAESGHTSSFSSHLVRIRASIGAVSVTVSGNVSVRRSRLKNWSITGPAWAGRRESPVLARGQAKASGLPLASPIWRGDDTFSIGTRKESVRTGAGLIRHCPPIVYSPGTRSAL